MHNGRTASGSREADRLSAEPLLSVIIPTYQRPEHLRACLRALCSQEFPLDRFEVIVVDDGGSVALEPIVGSFRGKLDVKLVKQRNAGPASARNTGASHARAPFLVFTDDDCLPEAPWLSQLYRQFTRTPDCLLGGAIVNGLPGNIYSSTTQRIQHYAYEYYSQRPDVVFLFNSNNMAAPAAHFHSLNGFSTLFRRAAGEDYDLCHQWHAAGLCMKYIPSARVCHRHPLSLRTFIRQHFNYGRGLLLCRMRMGEREGRKLRLEAAAFYIGLLFHPLWQTGPLRGLMWCALIALAQAATVAGAAVEAIVQAPAVASNRTAERNRNSV